MTNVVRVLFLIALFTVSIFASGGNPPAAEVVLEEMATIGGPEAALLFLWTGIAVDGDGGVYCSDALDYSIKKFGPDGVLLKKIGRRGSGAGEFEKPAGLALIGDYLYTWDLYAPALQVFDRDLVYRKTIPMPGSVDGLAVLPGGAIAAAVRRAYDRPSIIRLSPDGATGREFPLFEDDKPLPTGTVSMTADPDGRIYVGYLFRNLVENRSSEGKRIWSRAPMADRPNTTVHMLAYELPSETCVLSLARDSRGRIYVLGGSQAVHEGRDIIVFNPDGSTAAVFVLPEPSHSVYLDRQDFLYVSADGGVTVKKYRVNFR